MRLEDFLINPDKTILDALNRINLNQQGFLIVVDEKQKLLGTLTDGDIRRAVISGKEVNHSVDRIYKQNCRKVSCDDDFIEAIKVFQAQNIDFLPIVDKGGKLVNCITRKQMQSILLQDSQFSLNDDFMALYEKASDYEIQGRPWGFYKTTVLNDYYQSKVIHVRPKAALSLQKHNYREEYWIVVHGEGKVQIEDSIIYVREGSTLFIPKGCKHRLTNISDDETLILTEVQIGDYFGEDDIIRLEDKYGRL